MLKNQFSSLLKNYFTEFLLEKQALGFSYKSGRQILNKLDAFCIKNFPNEITITHELGLAWVIKQSTESMNALERRVSVTRELARYMNRNGIDAFVIPKGIGRSGTRYTPHIFTKSELVKFFAKLDRLDENPAAPIAHIAYPVIFRLLYTCGLRPIEALSLAAENVNLKTGVLFIEQSKGHKDRYVVLSDDMLELVRNYRRIACEIVPLSLYFFPNMRGGQILPSNLNRVFRTCWTNAKIPNSHGNPPRVYDFRHSFATKKLYEWHDFGKDINAMLPYLSAYMGHAHLSATAYYIHLVPEFFPNSTIVGIDKLCDLIPEVCYD